MFANRLPGSKFTQQARKWSCLLVAATAGLLHSLPSEAAKPEIEWQKVQQDGTQALDANEFWRAEPLLHEALQKAEGFGVRDLRMAQSLGEVGRLHLIRGRFADAEPYLEEELAVKELALGKETGLAIPTMGNLIKFYLTHGTLNKADPMAEDMLTMVEGKLNSPENQGKLKLQAGTMLTGWAGSQAPDKDDPLLDWSIACDSVGATYQGRKDYYFAERFYKAALDLKATVLGKEHLSLSNSYDSLGGLCMERNEMSEAESYYKDALAIKEKTLGVQSPAVYSALDKLAKCLLKQGKTRQAEELYVRARTFWKTDTAKNGDTARALYALGCIYCDEKRYQDAAPLLLEALNLADRVYGPSSISLVPYLEKYAYTLYYLGRKPETDQLRARANTITGTL